MSLRQRFFSCLATALLFTMIPFSITTYAYESDEYELEDDDDGTIFIKYMDELGTFNYPLDVKKYIKLPSPDPNCDIDFCKEVIPLTGLYAKELSDGTHVVIDIHIEDRESKLARRFKWAPMCTVFLPEYYGYSIGNYVIEENKKNKYSCYNGGKKLFDDADLIFTSNGNDIEVKEINAKFNDKKMPTGIYKKCCIVNIYGEPLLTDNGNLNFNNPNAAKHDNFHSVTAENFYYFAQNQDFMDYISEDDVFRITYTCTGKVNGVSCDIFEISSTLGYEYDYFAVDSSTGATYSNLPEDVFYEDDDYYDY